MTESSQTITYAGFDPQDMGAVPDEARERERPEPVLLEEATTERQPPLRSYLPHAILGIIALVAIIALAIVPYAPGVETDFIQGTLGNIAIGATGALAGVITRT